MHQYMCPRPAAKHHHAGQPPGATVLLTGLLPRGLVQSMHPRTTALPLTLTPSLPVLYAYFAASGPFTSTCWVVATTVPGALWATCRPGRVMTRCDGRPPAVSSNRWPGNEHACIVLALLPVFCWAIEPVGLIKSWGLWE